MGEKAIEAIHTLSPQQQGMLFETLYSSGPGIFVEQEVHTLQGTLHVSAFEQAWQRIVDRHAILRTAFVWKDQDEPLQVVLRHVTLPIEWHDARGLSESEQAARVQAHLDADRARGFDLSKAPLMRLALFQTGPQTIQFVWTLHHILMDGWCRPVIFKEFTNTYWALCKGIEHRLEPSRPYGDYVAWLKRQDLSEAEAFWRKNLAGYTEPTALGVKRDAGESSPPPRHWGQEHAQLSATATAAVAAWAREHRLTMNTLVQGAWGLLLHRYSGEGDVVFGTTVSGRPPELEGVESMVGLFISTLPFRITVSPDEPRGSWLQGIQARHLEIRRYEYCSTGQIHQWSEVPGWSPLYESVLVFQNYPVDPSMKGSGEGDEVSHDHSQVRGSVAQTRYPLTILAIADGQLRLQMIYDGRRLDGGSVARIARHFLVVLEGLASESKHSLRTLLQRIPADEIPEIAPLHAIGRQVSASADVAPRTPTEEVLANMWSEVLGLDRISIEDQFFDLGGHSLLATQLVSRLRDRFNIELPLRRLFEAGTIERLAPVIEELLLDEIEALSEDEAERIIKNW